MATPTYILHGWTEDVQKWQPVIKELKKYNVEAKLLPIPGLTAPLDKAWNLDDYVNWFSQIVGKNNHCNIIAHSFGGRVAIRYDVKNPNRVKKLVLIDSAGIRPMSIVARVKRASFKALATLGKNTTSNPAARSLLYKLAREQDYHKANPVLAQTMANIVKDDQREELAYVKAQTMLVWGAQDQTTPLSDGRLMNKMIIGSNLKIIDSARHSPQYTHPKEVADIIGHFLTPNHK